MGAARHVIEEERLIRRNDAELSHVADRLIRHVSREVVAGLSDPWKNLCVIAEQVGCPLVGLAAHEAIEVFETHPRGPLVVGARQAVLIARRVVVLAEPGRRIAVVFQDFTDAGVIETEDGIITWITGGLLGDHTETHGVMIAAGNQSRARGRAERRRVELGVAEPACAIRSNAGVGTTPPKVPGTP